MVKMACGQIENLCPQVINAALTLAARSDSAVAQRTWALDAWEGNFLIFKIETLFITSLWIEWNFNTKIWSASHVFEICESYLWRHYLETYSIQSHLVSRFKCEYKELKTKTTFFRRSPKSDRRRRRDCHHSRFPCRFRGPYPRGCDRLRRRPPGQGVWESWSSSWIDSRSCPTRPRRRHGRHGQLRARLVHRQSPRGGLKTTQGHYAHFRATRGQCNRGATEWRWKCRNRWKRLYRFVFQT